MARPCRLFPRISALQPAEADSRTQKLLRIDGVAVDACLVVEMRAGRTSGRADAADDLADLDRLADLDVDCRQVAIAGREPVAVVDLDHLAVAAVPAGGGDRAVRRGAHRIAGVAAHVETGV